VSSMNQARTICIHETSSHQSSFHSPFVGRSWLPSNPASNVTLSRTSRRHVRWQRIANTGAKRMSLVFNISNARDLLNKLRRDQSRLLTALSANDEEAIGDALFDFAVTGHSIKDWAKKAAALQSSSVDVEAFVHGHVPLQACRDIANSSKHHSITQYVVATARVYASCNAVFPTSGESTTGVEHGFVPIKIKIVMTDGIKLEIRQFSDDVVSVWDSLLTALGI